MSNIYQSKKRKKIKLIKLFRFIIKFSFLILLPLFLIYSSYYLFKKSNIFLIKKISVKTNYNYLKKSKILKLSKISLSDNLLAIDTKKIINNISKNPWVKRVKVRKVFPNKIKLTVDLKEICALIKEEETLFFSSCSGEKIEKYRPGLKKNLIIVESKNTLWALNIIKIISNLNNSEIVNLKNISEIKVDNKNYFKIKLTSREETILLNKNNLEKKVKQLEKVIKDIDSRKENISIIDASLDLNKIVVKK